MASYEQVLKFEGEKPDGVIRLVEANGFYRAYNQSAYLFHQAIAQHKVTRKFVKNIGQEIVYVGFPVDRLLERIGGRSHKKTDFGYDVELAEGEVPDAASYEEWRATVPTAAASRGDVNALMSGGDELYRALVDTLVLIQRINSTRDKVPLIGRARQLVAEIQVRMRVLRDVRALSIRPFTELFDRSESLSRQLANWQKFSQKVGSRVPRDRAEAVSDADVSPVSGGRPESAGSRSGGARQQANPMRDGAALSALPDNGGPTATTEATS